MLRPCRPQNTPAAFMAPAAHLSGSAALGWAGRHRGLAQASMPTAMIIDTAATAAAMACRAADMNEYSVHPTTMRRRVAICVDADTGGSASAESWRKPNN